MIDKNLLQQVGVPTKNIEQLAQVWYAVRHSPLKPEGQMPCIVCTGIYNAGKSTLLNVLCGDEKFPTGDIPTTKAVAQAEFGGAVYIDTPGINAQAEDDQEARSAYEKADFILFVSNAQNGGVGSTEAEWLQGLRERYTAESLQQRVIYVLTHCNQVDTEELPAIIEQAQRNLEQVCGVTPEKIFCVDSVTYSEGKKQQESLLVKESGVPELQTYLADRVKGAEKVLRKAQETELHARQKELAEALGIARKIAQKAYDTKNELVKTRVAAVDAAWDEFEKALAKTMPEANISPITCHIRLPSCSIYAQERSEFSVKCRIEERLKWVYDKRDQIVDDEVRKQIESIRSRYCSVGLDSAYATCCNQIIQVFNNSILQFQKLGLSVPGVDEFFVAPKMPSDLLREIEFELLHGVVKHSGYYTLAKYVDIYAQIDCFQDYAYGPFGISRKVWNYRTQSTSSVIKEMEKDIMSELDSKTRNANSVLNKYWKEFLEKLQPEVEKRKSALQSQVNAYKQSLHSDGTLSLAKEALSHLDTLAKEAGL